MLLKSLVKLSQTKISSTKVFTHLKPLILLSILTLTLCSLAIEPVKASSTIWEQTSNPSDEEEDEALAVAVDTTGVYIIGDDQSGADTQWRIEKRKLTDGTFITSFGTSGVVTSDPSISHERPNDVTIDSSGLYIVGFDGITSDIEWRIEKRNHTDGTIIWQQTNNPSSGQDETSAVAVDNTGIYIAGFDNAPDDRQWRIEKRDRTDGTLLWEQMSNPSTGFDQPSDLAVDSTGVYIVGFDNSPGNIQWRIEKRSLTDGTLISSFGSSGIVTFNPSTSGDQVMSVAVDDTGLYLIGIEGATLGAFTIQKRSLTDGTLLWTQISDPSEGTDRASDITVDDSGIYIVGYDSSPGDTEWRIEKRKLTDGTLIWEESNNPSSEEDEASGVALDESGIYIVGFDESQGTFEREWRIEKRFLSEANFTLSSDSSSLTIAKGTSGSSTINITSLHGFSQAVTLTHEWIGEAPTNVTVNLSSPITPPVDGSITTELQILVATAATAGTFTLNVTASSGDLTRQASLTITIPQGCIIATAAFNSPLAPEVAYMRHVRDNLIGSSNLGRMLVQGWNMFYYSWSPPIAERVTSSTHLQNMFRILLLPLIAIIHSTAFIYITTATINQTFASTIAFLFAATSSVTFYIGLPAILLRTIYRKRHNS